MNLWVGRLFLAAGLFLSGSAALTAEECQPLITPLSLADPGMMFGRTYFIMGYTDIDIFKTILKTTESSWLNMSQSPSAPNEVIMSQGFQTNGTCVASEASVTIDGDAATVSQDNVTSTFHLLPTCDGCLLFSINSTAKNIGQYLRTMNISSGVKELYGHSLYLMSRELTVKDSDLEQFKQQVSCLGFTGEPAFQHDPKKGFCKEGEGIKLKFT
ncbi:uncharacterized protein [Pempheris klunzingeri]|uniref:uncharacterized protein n=1 Tax=Pempheris klunzingeri TaxID=3127111 RepID=UPI00398033C4